MKTQQPDLKSKVFPGPICQEGLVTSPQKKGKDTAWRELADDLGCHVVKELRDGEMGSEKNEMEGF